MRHHAILWLITLFLAAPLAAQGTHKDEQLGFRFRPPSGWNSVPISTKEKWIVARYISDREYWPKKEMSWKHTPELKLILFPKALTNDRGVVVRKDAEKKRTTLHTRNPYKGFMDYLKANSTGGFYKSKEEETKVDGVPVTKIEIKFEKLTTARRGLVWIFHREDADWAFYFEGLEDYWRKLGPMFKSSLKSFKFIKRKGSLLEGRGATTGTEDLEIETNDERGMDPEVRAKKRKRRFDRELEKAENLLPKGWKRMTSKNYIALTHVDAKYTKRVLNQAEAVRKWMEKNLGWISDVEAGKAIIRICRDSDESEAYTDGSRDAWGSGYEINTYRDTTQGNRSWVIQWMSQRVANLWLRDKSALLAGGLPSWLDTGLDQVLSSSYLKGKRLAFKPDDWEMQQLRELARNEQLVKPSKLLVAPWKEFVRTEGATYQAGAFVRFLIDGPKSKTKGVLEKYMRELLRVLEEEEAARLAKMEALRKAAEEAAKSGKPVKSGPETEEEEEAAFRERRQAERKRLEKIYLAVLGTWSEKQWSSFDRAYMESVK